MARVAGFRNAQRAAVGGSSTDDKEAARETIAKLGVAARAIATARGVLRGAVRGIDASREVDAAIEALASARASLDGMTVAQRTRFTRQIRRALGYTFP